jgi:hypothetical protein
MRQVRLRGSARLVAEALNIFVDAGYSCRRRLRRHVDILPSLEVLAHPARLFELRPHPTGSRRNQSDRVVGRNAVIRYRKGSRARGHPVRFDLQTACGLKWRGGEGEPTTSP